MAIETDDIKRQQELDAVEQEIRGGKWTAPGTTPPLLESPDIQRARELDAVEEEIRRNVPPPAAAASLPQDRPSMFKTLPRQAAAGVLDVARSPLYLSETLDAALAGGARKLGLPSVAAAFDTARGVTQEQREGMAALGERVGGQRTELGIQDRDVPGGWWANVKDQIAQGWDVAKSDPGKFGRFVAESTARNLPQFLLTKGISGGVFEASGGMAANATKAEIAKAAGKAAIAGGATMLPMEAEGAFEDIKQTVGDENYAIPLVYGVVSGLIENSNLDVPIVLRSWVSSKAGKTAFRSFLMASAKAAGMTVSEMNEEALQQGAQNIGKIVAAERAGTPEKYPFTAANVVAGMGESAVGAMGLGAIGGGAIMLGERQAWKKAQSTLPTPTPAATPPAEVTPAGVPSATAPNVTATQVAELEQTGRIDLTGTPGVQSEEASAQQNIPKEGDLVVNGINLSTGMAVDSTTGNKSPVSADVLFRGFHEYFSQQPGIADPVTAANMAVQETLTRRQAEADAILNSPAGASIGNMISESISETLNPPTPPPSPEQQQAVIDQQQTASDAAADQQQADNKINVINAKAAADAAKAEADARRAQAEIEKNRSKLELEQAKAAATVPQSALDTAANRVPASALTTDDDIVIDQTGKRWVVQSVEGESGVLVESLDEPGRQRLAPPTEVFTRETTGTSPSGAPRAAATATVPAARVLSGSNAFNIARNADIGTDSFAANWGNLRVAENFVPRGVHRVAEKWITSLGRNVVWLEGEGRAANGLFSPNTPDTIFLRTNSTAPVVSVAIHEIYHAIDFQARRNPAVAEMLDRNFRTAVITAAARMSADGKRNIPTFEDWRAAHAGVISDRNAVEEFAAYIWQEAGNDPVFYESLRQYAPRVYDTVLGVFRKLVQAIYKTKFGKTYLDKIIDGETIKALLSEVPEARNYVGLRQRLTEAEVAQIYNGISSFMREYSAALESGAVDLADLETPEQTGLRETQASRKMGELIGMGGTTTTGTAASSLPGQPPLNAVTNVGRPGDMTNTLVVGGRPGVSRSEAKIPFWTSALANFGYKINRPTGPALNAGNPNIMLPSVRQSIRSMFDKPAFRDMLATAFGVNDFRLDMATGVYGKIQEPSFILKDMTHEQAMKIGALLGTFMDQDAYIATTPAYSATGPDRVTGILMTTDRAMTPSEAAAFRQAALDNGVELTLYDNNKMADTFFWGGDPRQFVENIRKVTGKGWDLRWFSARSGLYERKGYEDTLGRLWHTGTRGEPSVLFTGGVDNILAPYLQAVTKAGFRLNVKQLSRRNGFAQPHQAYIEQAIARQGETLASNMEGRVKPERPEDRLIRQREEMGAREARTAPSGRPRSLMSHILNRREIDREKLSPGQRSQQVFDSWHDIFGPTKELNQTLSMAPDGRTIGATIGEPVAVDKIYGNEAAAEKAVQSGFAQFTKVNSAKGGYISARIGPPLTEQQRKSLSSILNHTNEHLIIDIVSDEHGMATFEWVPGDNINTFISDVMGHYVVPSGTLASNALAYKDAYERTGYKLKLTGYSLYKIAQQANPNVGKIIPKRDAFNRWIKPQFMPFNERDAKAYLTSFKEYTDKLTNNTGVLTGADGSVFFLYRPEWNNGTNTIYNKFLHIAVGDSKLKSGDPRTGEQIIDQNRDKERLRYVGLIPETVTKAQAVFMEHLPQDNRTSIKIYVRSYEPDIYHVVLADARGRWMGNWIANVPADATHAVITGYPARTDKHKFATWIAVWEPGLPPIGEVDAQLAAAEGMPVPPPAPPAPQAAAQTLASALDGFKKGEVAPLEYNEPGNEYAGPMISKMFGGQKYGARMSMVRRFPNGTSRGVDIPDFRFGTVDEDGWMSFSSTGAMTGQHDIMSWVGQALATLAKDQGVVTFSGDSKHAPFYRHIVRRAFSLSNGKYIGYEELSSYNDSRNFGRRTHFRGGLINTEIAGDSPVMPFNQVKKFTEEEVAPIESQTLATILDGLKEGFQNPKMPAFVDPYNRPDGRMPAAEYHVTVPRGTLRVTCSPWAIGNTKRNIVWFAFRSPGGGYSATATNRGDQHTIFKQMASIFASEIRRGAIGFYFTGDSEHGPLYRAFARMAAKATKDLSVKLLGYETENSVKYQQNSPDGRRADFAGGVFVKGKAISIKAAVKKSEFGQGIVIYDVGAERVKAVPGSGMARLEEARRKKLARQNAHLPPAPGESIYRNSPITGDPEMWNAATNAWEGYVRVSRGWNNNYDYYESRTIRMSGSGIQYRQVIDNGEWRNVEQRNDGSLLWTPVTGTQTAAPAAPEAAPDEEAAGQTTNFQPMISPSVEDVEANGNRVLRLRDDLRVYQRPSRSVDSGYRNVALWDNLDASWVPMHTFSADYQLQIQALTESDVVRALNPNNPNAAPAATPTEATPAPATEVAPENIEAARRSKETGGGTLASLEDGLMDGLIHPRTPYRTNTPFSDVSIGSAGYKFEINGVKFFASTSGAMGPKDLKHGEFMFDGSVSGIGVSNRNREQHRVMAEVAAIIASEFKRGADSLIFTGDPSHGSVYRYIVKQAAKSTQGLADALIGFESPHSVRANDQQGSHSQFSGGLVRASAKDAYDKWFKQRYAMMNGPNTGPTWYGPETPRPTANDADRARRAELIKNLKEVKARLHSPPPPSALGNQTLASMFTGFEDGLVNPLPATQAGTPGGLMGDRFMYEQEFDGDMYRASARRQGGNAQTGRGFRSSYMFTGPRGTEMMDDFSKHHEVMNWVAKTIASEFARGAISVSFSGDDNHGEFYRIMARKMLDRSKGKYVGFEDKDSYDRYYRTAQYGNPQFNFFGGFVRPDKKAEIRNHFERGLGLPIHIYDENFDPQPLVKLTKEQKVQRLTRKDNEKIRFVLEDIFSSVINDYNIPDAVQAVAEQILDRLQGSGPVDHTTTFEWIPQRMSESLANLFGGRQVVERIVQPPRVEGALQKNVLKQARMRNWQALQPGTGTLASVDSGIFDEFGGIDKLDDMNPHKFSGWTRNKQNKWEAAMTAKYVPDVVGAYAMMPKEVRQRYLAANDLTRLAMIERWKKIFKENMAYLRGIIAINVPGLRDSIVSYSPDVEDLKDKQKVEEYKNQGRSGEEAEGIHAMRKAVGGFILGGSQEDFISATYFTPREEVSDADLPLVSVMDVDDVWGWRGGADREQLRAKYQPVLDDIFGRQLGGTGVTLASQPRTPGSQQFWQMPDKGRWTDRLRQIQNRFIDVKDAFWSIENMFGPIANAFNVDKQQKLYTARVAAATQQADQEFRPILNQMAEWQMTPAEVGQYMVDRRIPEYNALLAQRNARYVPGPGYSTPEAQARIAAIDPARRAQLDQIADMLDAFKRETHRQMVAYHLEPQNVINEWERNNPSWVSFQREGADDYGMGGDGTGQGFNVAGSMGRVAHGSNMPIDPAAAFTSFVGVRENTIKRGIKNVTVGHGVLGAAIAYPNPDIWRAIRPNEIQTPNQRADLARELAATLGVNPLDVEEMFNEALQARYNPDTGLMEYHVNPRLRSADYVFTTRVNGENRLVFFNRRDERAMAMARALKHLDVDQMNRYIAALSKFTRYISAVSTQYNPLFAPFNLVRDVGEANINLAATPMAGRQAEVMKNLGPAMKAMWRLERSMSSFTAPNLADPEVAMAQRFMQAGGTTGHLDYFENFSDRAKALEKEFRIMTERGTRGTALRGWNSLKNLISDYNSAVENATRLAVFKTGVENGMSDTDAAILSKEITVNFNDKGTETAFLNSLFAFFNAGVQGTATVARTLLEKRADGSVGLSKVGKNIIAGGIGLGVLQGLMLAMAGFGDDEPPEWVKSKNLIIPLGGGKYGKIPLPLGFAFLPNMGRMAVEGMRSGGKGAVSKGFDFIKMLLDQTNPMGELDSLGVMLTPTVLKPAVGIASNKDWAGRPIAKTDVDPMRPTPGYTRAFDGATVPSTMIAQALNTLGGGDEVEPGAKGFNWTPDEIDYLVANAFGGLGREAVKTVGTVGAAVRGDEVPLYKVPLVGRFAGETTGASAEKTKFYDNVKDAFIHKGKIEQRAAEDPAAMSKYVQENPEALYADFALSMKRQYDKTRRELKTLNKQGIHDYDEQYKAQMEMIVKQTNETIAGAAR